MKIKGSLKLENGYTLQIDMFALAKLEEMTGKNAFVFLDSMEAGSVTVTDMISIYHACLIRNHPDITFEQASDVFGDYPEAIGELMQASMPKAEASDLGNGRKAQTKRRKSN